MSKRSFGGSAGGGKDAGKTPVVFVKQIPKFLQKFHGTYPSFLTFFHSTVAHQHGIDPISSI